MTDGTPDPLALTKALIACPSVTPQDAGCLALIGEQLRAQGFEVQSLRFGEVENLWAERPGGGDPDEPVLCLAGHTDVVPTGPADAWRFPPFSPTEHEGALYGRGAADMKSGLAAMVAATARFVRERPRYRGRIAYLLTSDEEGPSVDGTARVVERLRERGQRIDWCIVGEPSSEQRVGDTIKIGRRGSLSAWLTVHGIQGHIAYPQLALNPIHALAPALAELVTHRWDEGDEHFQPTSFQVSNLNAGTGAPNVIPGELKARINLRFAPHHPRAELEATVESILQRHGVRYTLQWYLAGAPFYTPPGELSRAVTRAVESVAGYRPKLSTTGGTSDGRFIATLGAQVVELGVVNRTIHQVDEHVAIDAIEPLTQMYWRTLRELLPAR